MCTHWDAVPMHRGCVPGAGRRGEKLHSSFAGLSTSRCSLCENTGSVRELTAKRGVGKTFSAHGAEKPHGLPPGSSDGHSVWRRGWAAEAAAPRQQPGTFPFHPSVSSGSREDAEPAQELLPRSCCSSRSVAGPLPLSLLLSGPGEVSKDFCTYVGVP